jgi:acetyl-CoA C-acetyltransferase
MSDDPVVICSYARTPMGGFMGALSGTSATRSRPRSSERA